MKKYEVYATITAKIYLGEYTAKNRIEAAKLVIEGAEQLKADLCVEGLEDVSVVPYDSVEVEE